MEQDLFQLNDKVYSNNNNILLGIVSDLQQLISNSKDNLIIKRLSDIIIKLNYIIKENKKYLELIRKDISQLYNKLNNNINLKFNELNFNINQNQMMQNQMFQQQQQEIFQINQIQQFPIPNQIIQQQIPQMKITANSISIHFIDIARIGSGYRTVLCYDQDLLSSIINRYKLMEHIDSIENIIFLYNGKTLIPTLKAFEVGITKNANVYVLTKEQYEKNLINVFIKNENNSIKIQCLTYEKVNDIIERYRNISGDNLNVEFKFNDLYLERDSPIGGAGVGNNANIFVLRGIYVNFRVSGQSGQTRKPIRFFCNPGDKISDIIKEYRKLSGDYDQSKKFIFNARNLNQSLCACEAGIINNAKIFVVSTK